MERLGIKKDVTALKVDRTEGKGVLKAEYLNKDYEILKRRQQYGKRRQEIENHSYWKLLEVLASSGACTQGALSIKFLKCTPTLDFEHALVRMLLIDDTP